MKCVFTISLSFDGVLVQHYFNAFLLLCITTATKCLCILSCAYGFAKISESQRMRNTLSPPFKMFLAKNSNVQQELR